VLKKLLFLTSALLLIFGLWGAGSPSMANDTGPETIKLKSPSGKKPAQFPHKKHQESFTCNDCHHAKTGDSAKSPYEEGMQVNKCIFCHNKDDMANPKLNSFKLAAHGLCKECHKRNRDTAPTKCSGCHIK
jgi:hypothetical protein